MVIFNKRKKINELEAEIAKLRVQGMSSATCIKELSEKVKEQSKDIEEMKLTLENLTDDNSKVKTANQIMREYCYGEETK